MIDAKQLREALDESGCWMRQDYGDQHNEPECHTCIIDAAARLTLTVLERGEEIEWCEEHDLPLAPGWSVCLSQMWTGAKADCRITVQLRIPLSALRIADPDEEE